MPLPPRRKRKKGEPEPQAEKTKAETVYEEILHLPPEAGPELIELLESEKHILSQMAELEKKRFQEPMQQMWESIMEFSHKQERSKFDFKARSFE